jgi:hypothetical protein
MIKNINIYDLDGVVISSNHRYKTNRKGDAIDLAHWRKHDIPEFISKDSLLPHAAQYKADLLNPEIYVIIATARACIKDDSNYDFIHKHLGMPDKFIHRKGVDDNRHGHTLKIHGIKPLLNLKQFRDAVVTVFEDNATYLKHMCEAFQCDGRLIYSTQRF